jgi:hypothetical protein
VFIYFLFWLLVLVESIFLGSLKIEIVLNRNENYSSKKYSKTHHNNRK